MVQKNTRGRIVYIYMILDKYSDEDHPVSTHEIIKFLAEKGISAERKAIYLDIQALNDLGCNIIKVLKPKRGYFIADREFEFPEIRLLMEAVNSAGFITPKKTKNLIAKLETLLSVYQAKGLTSQVYCDAANKCKNEEIYYIIDALHEAIKKKQKVKFKYRRRTVDKDKGKRYTTKTFRVSPYALIWKDDHYYLVCNNQKYNNLMNLRVDRIRKLDKLYESIRPVGEVSEYKTDFDTAHYSSKMFNMFSGDVEEITLRCKLSMQEEIMDRFGESIPIIAADTEHFETTVDAAVSDGLVSWIMQYGGGLEVIKPDCLRQMVEKRAVEIAEIYK